MGPVQLIPFVGKALNEYVFPICLSLTILITITDSYNRLLRCCGKKSSYIAGNDSATSEKICDGKFIIEKYREEKLSDCDYITSNKLAYESDSVDNNKLLGVIEEETSKS